MRQWDGESTSELEACVCELRGKRAVQKGSPKKAVRVIAIERQEGHQGSPRNKRTEIASFNHGEGTSSISKVCQNTLTGNRNRGSLPLARRGKGMTGHPGLCGFDGLAHQIHTSIKL